MFFSGCRALVVVWILGVSGSAVAEQYYWFTAGVVDIHPERVTGASPGGVCTEVTEYVAQYYQKAWKVPVSGVGSLRGLKKQHVYCDIVLTHANGNYMSGRDIIRDGDGCESGSYNPHASSCTNGSLKGNPPPSCGASGNQTNMLIGNPIDFTSGNKIQQEVDFKLGAVNALVRTYNSIDGNWVYGYAARLHIFDSQSAVLYLPSGKEVPFNTYSTPAQAEALGAGRLQRKDGGWLYVDFDNGQYFFDAQGAYVGGIDAQQNAYTISREGTKLTVNYPELGQFELHVDEQGQLRRLEAADYSVDYHYEQTRLLSVTKRYASGPVTRTYHYEDPRDLKRLTGITDERGVRYATWRYDEQGRAIASEHADGADNVSINYHPDGAVTLTNPLGKQTTYRFTTILGSKRVTSIQGEPSSHCPGANSTFEYDAKGLVTKKVDNKGNVTLYTYDMYGREYIRTDAAGTPQERKTTTYWHSYLYLPSQVSDSKGVVMYRYDAKNNLISKQVNY